MAYTNICLVRFKAPLYFADKFEKKFTWRGPWYANGIYKPTHPNDIDYYDQYAAFKNIYSIDSAQIKDEKMKILIEWASLLNNGRHMENLLLSLILDYSDIIVCELFYQFHICDFYLGTRLGLRGVGTNIKYIINKILNNDNKWKNVEYPCLKDIKTFGNNKKTILTNPKLFRMSIILSENCYTNRYHQTNQLRQWPIELQNPFKIRLTYDIEWWSFVLFHGKMGYPRCKNCKEFYLCWMDKSFQKKFNQSRKVSMDKENNKYLPIWYDNCGKISKYPSIFGEKMKDNRQFINNFENNGWIEFTNQLKIKLDRQDHEKFCNNAQLEYRKMILVIDGLKNEKHLNNKQCWIKGPYNFEKERYTVCIHSNLKEQETYNVRPVNLKLVKSPTQHLNTRD